MNKLPRLPNPGNVLEARYTAEQMRAYGRKCMESAPQRTERVQFPTMLRRMWSGSDVQEWLDKHVNGGEA